MIQYSRKALPVYAAVDLVFLSLSFFFSYFLRYNSKLTVFTGRINLPNLQEYSFVFALWAVFVIIFLNRKGMHATDRNLSIPKEIFRAIISILYASIVMTGVIFFAKYNFFSRQIFFRSFLFLCLFLPGWRAAKRLLLRRLISQGYRNTNVLIIGAGKVGKVVWEEIRRHPYFGFKVVGFLDDKGEHSEEKFQILDKLSNFIEVAKKYFVDEVIITIPSERKVIANLIEQAKGLRLGIRIVPEDFEQAQPVLDVSYLGMLQLLTYKERRFHPAEIVLKRLFDWTAALIFLIVFSPLFIITAALIKLNSRGPIFYVQKRTGYKNKPFNFYKFRSMVKNADDLKQQLLDKNESKGNIIFKMRNDPRITSIGRFLRKYSVDEFPQIFNVLKGDMSLVGPRPFPVDESKKLIHDHLERFMIRPGITGMAQIKGRSDLSFYHWGKWDLWYVNNWSFGLDLKILLWTIPAILKGRGAY
ncbi:MAG: sugar transferase [Candidatus Omnitrophota bacterium]